MTRYLHDPVAYAREVLGVDLWPVQEAICRSMLTAPYKTLVKASHNVGKTFTAACLANWWYDTRDPGLVLSSAPTQRQVCDLLWKEIRVLRERIGKGADFTGPKAPRMESSPDHFAHGFTARDSDSFQGHHGAAIMFIFDEAVGISPDLWEAAKTMFGGEGHAWLSIFNPTDTTSQAYAEEDEGNWTLITMSALDHPNIREELAGRPAPFPSAIRLGRLEEMLAEWCQPVQVADHRTTDIEWPPGSSQWLRPGPIAEARLLGRWPSAGTYGVWSDADWIAAEHRPADDDHLPIPHDGQPEIGCDVARFGDDWTTIHARWGPASLAHERGNGWDTTQTTGRLVELAKQLAALATKRGPEGRRPVDPREIKVKVDDDGVGGGVVDQGRKAGYRFLPVSAAATAHHPGKYPNRRSEIWFDVVDRARMGRLSLTRLDGPTRRRLRSQAMAPVWWLDAAGRRVVEPKQETKERTGTRSPDDMDGMNLAYYEGLDYEAPVGVEVDRKSRDNRESAAARRGMFGR